MSEIRPETYFTVLLDGACCSLPFAGIACESQDDTLPGAGMSAEPSGRRNQGPTDVDLANYARAYMGAYMGAVQSESPEHPPVFYKNHPYSIEACYMPNDSFCLLFEKSERPTIAVTSQNWEYVMGKVMSGVSYLATVYPHEGFSVDDAVAKGRRDAIRDIRAIESSDMVDATRQLEKAISELSNMGDWTKNPVKMAETVMSRLEPIRQAVQRSGPTVDMLAMVDGLRRCSITPASGKLDPDDLEAMSGVSSLMSDLTTMLRDVKLQGEKLEDVQEHLRGELHDFKIELDKKIAKGLGVILATTDRKIDKAIASSHSPAKDPGTQSAVASLADEVTALKSTIELLRVPEDEDDLPARFEELVEEVAAVRSIAENIRIPDIPIIPEPKVPGELVLKIDTLANDVAKVSMRIKRIEDYLTAVSATKRTQR